MSVFTEIMQLKKVLKILPKVRECFETIEHELELAYNSYNKSEYGNLECISCI